MYDIIHIKYDIKPKKIKSIFYFFSKLAPGQATAKSALVPCSPNARSIIRRHSLWP